MGKQDSMNDTEATMRKTKVFSASAVVGDFGSNFLNEEKCAEYLLRKVHGDDVICPGCSLLITGKQSETFWKGKQITCKCGKRFQGSSDTFFKGSFGSYAEFYLVVLLIGMGKTVGEISAITGKDRKTVSKWRTYFETIESYSKVNG